MANNVKKFLDYTGVTRLVELMSAYISTYVTEYVGTQFSNRKNDQYHTIICGEDELESADHLGKIEFEGTGATSVSINNAADDPVKIIISSTDERVSSVATHYTPGGDGVNCYSGGATKTLSSINVDAAGHIISAGATDIAFPVTSVSAGTNGELVKVNVTSTSSDVKISLDDSNLVNTIQGGTHFAGLTTTVLSDGSTTNTIVIGGKNYTAKLGDIVISSISSDIKTDDGSDVSLQIEFIWDGTKWNELGDSTANAKRLTSHDIRLDELESTVDTHIKSSHVTSVTCGTGLSPKDKQTGDVSISLLPAADNEIGGIKTGYTETAKNYAVNLTNDYKAYVTVPWVDTNTTDIKIGTNAIVDTPIDPSCTADCIHYFVDAIDAEGDTITYTRKGFGCLTRADIDAAFAAAFPTA